MPREAIERALAAANWAPTHGKTEVRGAARPHSRLPGCPFFRTLVFRLIWAWPAWRVECAAPEDASKTSNMALAPVPAAVEQQLAQYAAYRQQPFNRHRSTGAAAVEDTTVESDRANALRWLGYLKAEHGQPPSLRLFAHERVERFSGFDLEQLLPRRRPRGADDDARASRWRASQPRQRPIARVRARRARHRRRRSHRGRRRRRDEHRAHHRSARARVARSSVAGARDRSSTLMTF